MELPKMKPIFETKILNGQATAGIYVDGTDFAVMVKTSQKLILTPVLNGINKGVDKLEDLVPGDQKELAEKLKGSIGLAIGNMIIEALTKPEAVAEVQSEVPVAHV